MANYRHRGRPAAARPVPVKASQDPDPAQGFPLDQFEQYIDETILKRGLSYFKKGQVLEVEERSPGEYEGRVQGTETYTVNLGIRNGSVTDCICDCPYDLGPVCKHAAAVIFHLQREALGMDLPEAKPGKKTVKPPAKRLTKAEQVEELLAAASHEELREFVRKLAAADRAISNMVLASFATQETGRESKSHYAKQIKSLLTQAAGRHRFIPVSMAAQVNAAMNQYLLTAQTHIRKGNYRSALFIGTAVLEEMTKALQIADDSYGDIGDAIRSALNLLTELAGQPLPEEIRKSLLDYCCTSNQKEVFEDWDWHLDILEIAIPLLTTDAEEARVVELLVKDARSSSWRRHAQKVHFSLLQRRHGDEVAFEFILKHLDNPDMRAEAIRLLVERKEFERAKTLALEGLAAETRHRSGLRQSWLEWLLRIAQEEGESASIVRYARELYFQGFLHDPQLFELMKATVDAREWPSFLERLIEDIRNGLLSRVPAFLGPLYAAESRWEDLLAMLADSPDLGFLDEFAPLLLPTYRDGMIELYDRGIRTLVAENTGRSYYVEACRYLRKLRKMGGTSQVEELIAHFRQNYKSRRALMEELARV